MKHFSYKNKSSVTKNRFSEIVNKLVDRMISLKKYYQIENNNRNFYFHIVRTEDLQLPQNTERKKYFNV